MQIGFLLFPGLTQLDLTGPAQFLSRLPGAKTNCIARTKDPVATGCGFSMLPDTTFSESPKLDLICVPGGRFLDQAIQDTETMAFIRQAGNDAHYVTSVCTGAFIIGAAGFLRNKAATTHWAYAGLLEKVGAIYTPGRVVRDGNIITGGGVTAGIDFALTVIREIKGDEAAQRVQLALEYDPAPPFDSGHPDRAPASLAIDLRNQYGATAVDALARMLDAL